LPGSLENSTQAAALKKKKAAGFLRASGGAALSSSSWRNSSVFSHNKSNFWPVSIVKKPNFEIPGQNSFESLSAKVIPMTMLGS
jgi:hypothetical protein